MKTARTLEGPQAPTSTPIRARREHSSGDVYAARGTCAAAASAQHLRLRVLVPRLASAMKSWTFISPHRPSSGAREACTGADGLRKAPMWSRGICCRLQRNTADAARSIRRRWSLDIRLSLQLTSRQSRALGMHRHRTCIRRAGPQGYPRMVVPVPQRRHN